MWMKIWGDGELDGVRKMKIAWVLGGRLWSVVINLKAGGKGVIASRMVDLALCAALLFPSLSTDLILLKDK